MHKILEVSISRENKKCEYLSNDNKHINMGIDHGLKMDLSRRKIRLLLLHELRLGRRATEATNNIRNTMGEDVLLTSTA